ncbi:hypothetical protein [Parendozoicomonas haliclonae]|uniref:Bacterial type II/III secretion system short domain protein n=1 Tax=Parendozoicomonas haliclonae TaxID=1960125 RepID=A0A1X7AIN2_9GAMM|nr:hypothetical protein [Parendozoicomonas haliclonae]SMA45467.1 hypothetical protein EHSB41UT_01926 [Parendozoicomonas haliclonae]
MGKRRIFSKQIHSAVKVIAVGVSLSFVLMSPSFANERELVVIPLSYSVPDQVLPAVKALLPEDATVSSYNNQLILKVTDKEKALVEDLLKQIDTVPQQLLITVRTPKTRSYNEQKLSAEGTFANGRVQVGNSDQPGTITIRSDSAKGKSNGTQSVRATAGMPAYIAVGQSRPVTTVQIDGLGNRQYVTEYLPADQGFYVIPRLVGEQVLLDILQTDDKHGSQAIDTRRVSTTVSGGLGQWIEIGSTGSATDTSKRGLTVRSDDASSESGLIELRVEKL